MLRTVAEVSSDARRRNLLLAIAALGPVLYSAAAHFASWGYAFFPAIASYGSQRQWLSIGFYWLDDVITIVLVYCAFRVLPLRLRPDLGWRPASVWWYGAAIAAGVAVWFLNDLIVRGYQFVGISGTGVLTGFSHPSLPVAYALLIEVGILSPIIQEIVFRGWLFSGLQRILPLAAASSVSAGVFALFHIQNGLPAVTYTFVSGLIFAAFFSRSRSVVPPAIIHVVLNSTSAIMWLLR
jgi:membrane protease YdiL (CAAX protease family)